MTTVSVIVLSMGDRPVELAAAIESARKQQGVEVEVVLVVNGGDPDVGGADVVVRPGENLGIPGGRNAGVDAATGHVLAFLDDDAAYLQSDGFDRACQAFDADTRLGALGLLLVDEEGATARRHQPRIGGTAARGPASSFPGGASIIRRDAFEEVGGLCAAYHYGLEETDLAWRLLDAGWTILFDTELTVFHPRTEPSRHAAFHHHTGRNRVWLAHRCLPAPLALAYVTDWAVVTALRSWRNPRNIASYARGTLDGFRRLEGPRRPMRWRTVRQLTRLGRPPII
ncbi:MAG: glycosyltransferase [Actinomycetota bacterium]